MISVYKDFDDAPAELKGEGERFARSVINKLFDIYHGKCAYCEQMFRGAPIFINRYRPVRTYPWLKNEWSNLLPMCSKCKSNSGARFPISGSRIETPPPDKMQRRSDSRTLRGEKPLLLNPEIDTPENHLYFDPQGILYSRTERGKETIHTFGLNRHELIAGRKEIVDSFRQAFYTSLSAFTPYRDYAHTENRYINGKLVHDILFKDVFRELKEAGEPRAEYSLLGRNMLENFDRFFIDYFSPQEKKNKNDRELFGAYQRVLGEAVTLFTKTDDIVKFRKTEKAVPFFPKEPGKKKRMEKGLPYAVKAFEIQNYYGIKHTRVEGLPINTRWIFLTGENGFGKTLILQALALGLNGNDDEGAKLADDNCRVKLELKNDRSNTINILHGPFIHFKNFVAYGPSRLSIDGDVFEGKQAPEKVRKTDSLFQNTTSLYNIQEYLIQIHGRKKFEDKFNAVVETLKILLPWVEDIIVDDGGEKKKILYREKTGNGEVMDEIPFGALSAGSKSIIAMIGDMLIELLKHQDTSHPGDLKGIVIIDEIDIHLHAKWQREFVTRLTQIFPRIQFIASTHSPIPLLGAPRETVILNVDKENKKEGIVVQRLRIDVTNLTPDTILSSPVFNFQRIIPEAHDRRKPLRTQDDYSEVLFNKVLNEKLDKLADEGGMRLTELMKEEGVDSRS